MTNEATDLTPEMVRVLGIIDSEGFACGGTYWVTPAMKGKDIKASTLHALERRGLAVVSCYQDGGLVARRPASK